jgi:predicted DNA-binding transcriptional regulator AlpA
MIERTVEELTPIIGTRPACRAVGAAVATIYRRRRPPEPRPSRPRPTPAKLGPRQVKLAREMYNETGEDGKRKHTVAHIPAEFSVSRPTIYRHLAKSADSPQPAA